MHSIRSLNFRSINFRCVSIRSVAIRSIAIGSMAAAFLSPIAAMPTCSLLLADTPIAPIPRNAIEARLIEDIKFLASDDLKGRSAETPGLRMGAEFIAKRWQELGLKTDLFNGGPLQEFPLDGSTSQPDPKTNHLSIAKPSGAKLTLALGEQFQPQSLGRNGIFDGGLVFAGYGITANEEDLKYDDFANLDVRGKVVIAIRKEPQQNDPNSPFDGTSPSQFALFTAKQINAAKHGVAALILVNDSDSEKANPNMLLPVSGGGSALTTEQVPTLFVRRSDVASWLAEAGRKLEDIEMEIDRDLKPRSFELAGWQASGATEIAKLKSMNVVGVLEGNGELADEYVVLGAHFDHVGMGGPGSLAPGTIEVHNGADDNASGTVCLLEAARKLTELAKNNPGKPRRTTLFIAFSGEERGLLGSLYYVKHPRFDLAKTVAMLNMDMVGRLKDNNLTIYGTGTATEFDAMITKANESLALLIQRSPEGMGPSDHQSFFQKNIPVLHFFTGLHDDYHRPGDDIDKINFDGMVRITEMVSVLANQIGTDVAKPTFVKVKGRANPQANRQASGPASGPKRVRLGVRLNMTSEGVVVERVLADGIAAKAGILAGDRILKLDKDETTSRSELDRLLQKLKKGEKTNLLVERGSEKIELIVEVTE